MVSGALAACRSSGERHTCVSVPTAPLWVLHVPERCHALDQRRSTWCEGRFIPGATGTAREMPCSRTYAGAHPMVWLAGWGSAIGGRWLACWCNRRQRCRSCLCRRGGRRRDYVVAQHLALLHALVVGVNCHDGGNHSKRRRRALGDLSLIVRHNGRLACAGSKGRECGQRDDSLCGFDHW